MRWAIKRPISYAMGDKTPYQFEVNNRLAAIRRARQLNLL